jgi:penicillin amidase
MMALGYVHAQDRLWQMELMRRIARSSEIFLVVLQKRSFFSGESGSFCKGNCCFR